MPVKFGLQLPIFTFPSRPGENIFAVAREIAQTAEELGFDSLWFMDHLSQIPPGASETEPLLECWTGLAAMAACTKKMKLGSMVTAASLRPPSILAKMTATVDNVSDGRLIVGIGSGWVEWEHKAYGLEFPSVGVRLKRLEETILILKEMWTQERATFEGEYFQVRDAVCNPKPIQKPHPPLLIGGRGEKVTLRIAAKYAQAYNTISDPPEVYAHLLKVLRQHCQEVGTDYDAILKTFTTAVTIAPSRAEVDDKVKRLRPAAASMDWFAEATVIGTPDEVAARLQEYVDLGTQYLILSFWDVDEIESLRLFAREVMPRFA